MHELANPAHRKARAVRAAAYVGDPMTKFNWKRAAALCLLAGICGWYAIRGVGASGPVQPVQPVIPVTSGKAELRDIPVYAHSIGTVQASNTVTVKTRVDGPITEVLFKEGQEVKEGDPLFQIDPRPYKATLDQAEANRLKDQAQLDGAQRNLERYSKLITTGFQTRQSYDDQEAMVAQLHGAVKADQALIESERLNLEYARILAPISGRTGGRLVDKGNFVQAVQATSLVTIAELIPSFVTFSVPQDLLGKIRRNQVSGPLKVVAYDSGDETLLAEGELTLIDNRVDTTTGTVELKATFGNADELLWPGEAVNVRLLLSVRKNAVIVPAQAIMQGSDSAFAYLIKPDKTVQRRDVAVADTQDGLAIIENGLSANDTVVVNGQYRLTDGAKVEVDPAEPES